MVCHTDDVLDLAIDRSQVRASFMLERSDGGVFVSADSGNTWQTFNDGLGNLDINETGYRVLQLPVLLYAGTDDGVWKIQLGEVQHHTEPTIPDAPQTFLPLNPANIATPYPTFTPTPTHAHNHPTNTDLTRRTRATPRRSPLQVGRADGSSKM